MNFTHNYKNKPFKDNFYDSYNNINSLNYPLNIGIGSKTKYSCYVCSLLVIASAIAICGSIQKLISNISSKNFNLDLILSAIFLPIFVFLFLAVILAVLRFIRDIDLQYPIITITKDEIWDKRVMFSSISWSEISRLEPVYDYSHGRRLIGLDLHLKQPIKVKFDFFFIKNWPSIIKKFDTLSDGKFVSKINLFLLLLAIPEDDIAFIITQTYNDYHYNRNGIQIK